MPETKEPPEHPRLRVTAAQVATLENWIDAANEPLAPLTSFVLPGGSAAATHLQHARAVCRRVEIGVCRLASEETVNVQVLIYLNRLSDLLFVLARPITTRVMEMSCGFPAENVDSVLAICFRLEMIRPEKSPPIHAVNFPRDKVGPFQQIEHQIVGI